MRSLSILLLILSVVASASAATFHTIAEPHRVYTDLDQGLTLWQTSSRNGPSEGADSTTLARNSFSAIRILCQNQIRGGGSKSSSQATATKEIRRPETKKIQSKQRPLKKGRDASKNKKKFHIDFRERKVQIGLLASILFCYPIITM